MNEYNHGKSVFHESMCCRDPEVYLGAFDQVNRDQEQTVKILSFEQVGDFTLSILISLILYHTAW